MQINLNLRTEKRYYHTFEGQLACYDWKRPWTSIGKPGTFETLTRKKRAQWHRILLKWVLQGLAQGIANGPWLVKVFAGDCLLVPNENEFIVGIVIFIFVVVGEKSCDAEWKGRRR